MVKAKMWFIMLIVISVSGLHASNYPQELTEKKVKCSVEIMPNYMWHLFALSNLWDKKDSPYRAKYESTIPKKDLEFIYKNRSLFVWGNGLVGKFTPLLFFVPFTKEISQENYFSYLDEVEKTFVNNDWLDFALKYCPEYLDRMKNLSYSKEELEIFKEAKRIIKDNFAEYNNSIWKEVNDLLEKEGGKINSYFENKDMIVKWEKALNMEYPGEGFYPVLTYANSVDGLVSANNLSQSRNNFGITEKNFEWTADLMIHEIGVFTFMPVMMAIYNDPSLQTQENQKNNAVYQAIESYIEMKKGEVSGDSRAWEGKMQNGSNFDFPWFFKFYKENADKYTSEVLIRNAIKEYVNSKK